MVSASSVFIDLVFVLTLVPDEFDFVLVFEVGRL